MDMVATHEDFVKVSPAGDLVPNMAHTRPAQLAPHPVEVIQQNYHQIQDQLEMAAQQNAYGMAFPVTIKMQEAMVGSFERPSHLPSSHVALEILQGRDEDIDYEDVMGDPEMSVQHVEMAHAMEAKLGIQMPQML